MKELSIEEKAKRYDEAIERANKWYNAPNVDKIPTFGNRVIEEISPELAEAEDERIRKGLLQIAKESEDSFYMVMTPNKREKLIAWLEKQGGQKHADKVESNFEIGDLITNGILVGKIDGIHELGYHAYFGDHYADIPDIENWHKWTIQDAKEGDILAFDNDIIVIFKDLYKFTSFHSYCYFEYDIFDYSKDELPDEWEGKGFKPATKEQCDRLFQKMKEAGYEWDAKNKQLRKIESKQEELTEFEKAIKQVMEEAIECGDTHNLKADADMLLRLVQNPVWGEEDEKELCRVIYMMEQLDLTESWSDCYAFLNSLKDKVQPQNTWKPSDEQMKVLDKVIKNPHLSTAEYNGLIALKEQLKAL